MDTKRTSPRRGRMLGLAAVIALLAMLLPAAAGVALGHTASSACDHVSNDYSLDAHVFLQGTVYAGYANMTGYVDLPAISTVSIAPGSYYVVWSDDFTQGVTSADNSNQLKLNQNSSTPLGVSICVPAITTTATAGPVAIGNPINDTAHLTGTTSTAVGSITFKAYGPETSATCTSTDLVFTSNAISVSGSSDYGSGNFTPVSVGTYYWIASYSGDTYNKAVTTACGDSSESSVVNQASATITTTPSPGGLIGTVLNDSATLTGGNSPTGSITFKLYASGTSCTGTPIYAQTVALPASSPYTAATTPGFTTTAIGTYYWTASYPGDANNTAASSGCGAEAAVITVPPTIPTVTTQLSESSGTVGDSVYDTATLHGFTSNAGGTVTYTVYNDNQCTLGARVAGTVTVTEGVVPNSNSIIFDTAGTFYWQAVYSGDATNAGPVSSACTSETLVISSPTPIVTPTPYQSFEGATSVPSPSQQVEAATGAPVRTPPVTGTDSNGSSNGSAPLFALLICFAFGGLGLAAVGAQRRTVRR